VSAQSIRSRKRAEFERISCPADCRPTAMPAAASAPARRQASARRRRRSERKRGRHDRLDHRCRHGVVIDGGIEQRVGR
jgi:hypothetical protein